MKGSFQGSRVHSVCNRAQYSIQVLFQVFQYCHSHRGLITAFITLLHLYYDSLSRQKEARSRCYALLFANDSKASDSHGWKLKRRSQEGDVGVCAEFWPGIRPPAAWCLVCTHCHTVKSQKVGSAYFARKHIQHFGSAVSPVTNPFWLSHYRNNFWYAGPTLGLHWPIPKIANTLNSGSSKRFTSNKYWSRH